MDANENQARTEVFVETFGTVQHYGYRTKLSKHCTHRSNCLGVSGNVSEDGLAIETKSNSSTPGTRSARPILKNPSVMPLNVWATEETRQDRRGGLNMSRTLVLTLNRKGVRAKHLVLS